MKVYEAESIVGGFSEPSKMPCFSWSIPARLCKVGSKLAKIAGTVCSKCYALKGRYVFPNVQEALDRRYGMLLRALTEPDYRAQFIAAFVRRLQGETHFRWFDSGDLQSVEHLELIADIVRATPDVDHWLPTREQNIVRAFKAKHELPINLMLRVSAQKVDAQPPAGFFYTSTVHSDPAKAHGMICEAYTRGGKCGPCRACWDGAIPNISYPEH